jgi:DNA-binding MarR family transcriptional regulator
MRASSRASQQSRTWAAWSASTAPGPLRAYSQPGDEVRRLREALNASNADLARACNTTPQAMNGVLATLEREHLIERRPHPTHGRILQVTLSHKGEQTLEAAHPAVRELEREAERTFSPDEIAIAKS